MAIFHQIGGISSSSIGNVFKNPLSSLLEGGKGNVLNLKFPEDLGTDASRMHCVQIEIYNIISASAQQKVQAKETNPSTRETLFGKLNKVAESTVESAKNAITSVASDATKARQQCQRHLEQRVIFACMFCYSLNKHIDDVNIEK